MDFDSFVICVACFIIGFLLGGVLVYGNVAASEDFYQPYFVNENDTTDYYPVARLEDVGFSNDDDYLVYVSDDGSLHSRNVGNSMDGEWFIHRYNGTKTIFVVRADGGL
jgi:hypothetical protein